MKHQPDYSIVSDRVANIDEALSIYMNQLTEDLKRRKIDITVMSAGEAYFEIPLFDFAKLKKDSGYHYSSSRGLLELREKLCNYYNTRFGSQCNADYNILITSGSKIAIFMAFQAIVNRGDEVLIHEPAWLSYKEQCRLLDAIPKFIPYDCSVEEFDGYVTDKTRILVINNPNNPSGRLYTSEELQCIIKLCRARGIVLLADEAYCDFVTCKQFTSVASLVPDLSGVIVVNSLSKNMGLSGFRIGYVLASDFFISSILKLNQHLITCAPTILLMYITQYFDEILRVTLPQAIAVTERRNKFKDYMNKLGLTYLDGDSTFYFLISLGDSPNCSMNFSLCLLMRDHIAVVPGSAYGNSVERFVRVSIGVEPDERIFAALERIAEVIKEPLISMEDLSKMSRGVGVRPFQARI